MYNIHVCFVQKKLRSQRLILKGFASVCIGLALAAYRYESAAALLGARSTSQLDMIQQVFNSPIEIQ